MTRLALLAALCAALLFPAAAGAAPAVAQGVAKTREAVGNADIIYDIAVLHIDRRDAAWRGLDEEPTALDANTLVGLRTALWASDRTPQIVARPRMTATEAQLASFEIGRSGGEFLQVSVISTVTPDGFDLDFRFSSDETRGEIVWSGLVPVVLDGAGGLAVRPRRDLVVLLQLASRPQLNPTARVN